MKKFLKDLLFLFLITVSYTILFSRTAFAVNDSAMELEEYSARIQKDGNLRFTAKEKNLRIWPNIGILGDIFGLDDDNDKYNGDLDVELNAQNPLKSNPFCLGQIIVAFFAMKAAAYLGGSYYFAAAMALIAMVAIIYRISMTLYNHTELCGADWLVWGTTGNGDDVGPGSATNIKKYYPTFSDFPGSRKYADEWCRDNIQECMNICKNKIIEREQKEENKSAGDTLSEVRDGIVDLFTNKPFSKKNNSDIICSGKECLEEDACLLDYEFMKKFNRDYLTINDRVFRELYYDGEEVINKKCVDPREEAKNYDINQNKSANKIYQTYYMRGQNKSNFACDRYRISETEAMHEAYNCCLESSRSMCVHIYDTISSGYYWCDTDGIKNTSPAINFSICKVAGYLFKVTGSEQDNGKYCLSTYSLCPYNFNIERGTERTMEFEIKQIEDTVDRKINSNCKTNCKTVSVKEIRFIDECCNYDEDGNCSPLPCKNKIKNFHQYQRHCTVIEEWADPDFDEINYAPFIDRSCINFVGSSHNTEGYANYTGYQKLLKMRSTAFSAPIAECYTETLKNFLFNRAGHTRCLPNENGIIPKPDDSGNCESGYVFIEGDDLKDKLGVFSPVQKLLTYIHNLIMLALVLMVTLYGYNLLISGGQIDKVKLTMMMLKAVIVIVFSTNSWWYTQLFKFTYGFSNTFSMLTAKIGFNETKDLNGNYVKYDGCYFGDITNILGKDISDSAPNIVDNNYASYPVNRRYVAFFDTLDCKVAKYLGFSVGKNVGNLVTTLALAIFVWPVSFGLYLPVATLLLFLFVVSFAVKAVYIFIASSMAIAVMLYISPLVIPCILFDRTKGIFDGWLKNLISFCLQPMVMFAFVGMSLTIMDEYILGEGLWDGNGVNKELICGYACVDKETGFIISHTSNRSPSSKELVATECENGNVIDLKHSSVLCNMEKTTTNWGNILLSLGLIIPLLIDVFSSDLIMYLRVAFLFFILSRCVSTIPAIAAYLTGGKQLPTIDADPFKLYGAIKNHASVVARLGKGIARGASKKSFSAIKGIYDKIKNNFKGDSSIERGSDNFNGASGGKDNDNFNNATGGKDGNINESKSGSDNFNGASGGKK